MSTAEKDKVLGHEYDGIREYDNPLPGWWLTLFWGTIAFSLLYVLYYQIGNGPTVEDEYKAGMLFVAELQSKELLKAGPITDEKVLQMGNTKDMLAAAQSLFQNKCATCHGERAEGKIGPNLTDDYWLHGGKPAQIYTTITNGVTEKGMIAWKTQLRPTEIIALAAYVTSLHGSNPPNPKPPQGEIATPGPAAVEPASPKTK